MEGREAAQWRVGELPCGGPGSCPVEGRGAAQWRAGELSCGGPGSCPVEGRGAAQCPRTALGGRRPPRRALSPAGASRSPPIAARYAPGLPRAPVAVTRPLGAGTVCGAAAGQRGRAAAAGQRYNDTALRASHYHTAGQGSAGWVPYRSGAHRPSRQPPPAAPAQRRSSGSRAAVNINQLVGPWPKHSAGRQVAGSRLEGGVGLGGGELSDRETTRDERPPDPDCRNASKESVRP